MKDIVEIKPIQEDPKDYDELEKRLKKFFLEHLYIPLLKELNLPKTLFKNAKNENPLLEALFTGRITYTAGAFRGKFNSSISKELKEMGAKFDRKTSSFKIEMNQVPTQVKQAISVGDLHFQKQMQKLDQKLASILPEKLADQFKSEDLFDKTLFKADKSFQKNVENISNFPKLTEEQRAKISKDWQNNMRLYIKDWTQDQIKDIRAKIYDQLTSGARREELIPPILKITRTIQDSHEQALNKAKFLARQESRLMMATFKETRYQDAGIHEYVWRCVHRPFDSSPHHHTPGNVRYSHGILNGKIFRFNNPPLTTAPGEPARYNNPGKDYNCIPGDSRIGFYSSINKAFRRSYSGKLTTLIGDNGIVLNTTAHHPVLTGKGWINAKDVQLGDYLFTTCEESFFTKEMNSKDVESSAEQIFNALSLCAQITSDTLSETDFHNDIGTDQKVDIININWELIMDTISQAYQELFHFLLKRTYSSSATLSTTNRFLNSILSGSTNFMSILSELQTILFIHLTHANNISFRTISNMDFTSNEPFPNRSTSDSIFLRNSKLTHPILIIVNSLLNSWHRLTGLSNMNAKQLGFLSQSFSINTNLDRQRSDRDRSISLIKSFRIQDIKISEFIGHIYNFETLSNWYLAQSVIIHNCRCFSRPILRKK
jgi:hypothetical protein